MIDFIEHHEIGYSARTVANAQAAGLTIAFADDYTTAGEILTHKAAYGKYYRVPLSEGLRASIPVLTGLNEILDRKPVKEINLAGNGIYSLPYSQEEVDEFMYNFLFILSEMRSETYAFRSGGQTGIDEAGVKAADRLGFKSTCLAPRGWMFRNKAGVDLAGEAKFKARFL